LLLDPLILVGSILHLIVVYYLIRFGILAEIVGLLKIRISGVNPVPNFLGYLTNAKDQGIRNANNPSRSPR
ncbi:hypothetical protein PIB30_103686, partial [Stylosanthes scabra]|nr:hypothetical protein [Stylosanthes scabra]